MKKLFNLLFVILLCSFYNNIYSQKVNIRGQIIDFCSNDSIFDVDIRILHNGKIKESKSPINGKFNLNCNRFDTINFILNKHVLDSVSKIQKQIVIESDRDSIFYNIEFCQINKYLNKQNSFYPKEDKVDTDKVLWILLTLGITIISIIAKNKSMK